MKQEDRRNLRNRKRRIAWRLRPREWPERPRPMFAASNIQYEMSERQRGITGEVLLQLLERRLDNVVYRLGFAPSRKTARQIVNHGHIILNGKMTNIGSLKVKPGDVIQVRDRKGSRALVGTFLAEEEGRVVPGWLSADPGSFRGEVKSMPAREDVSLQLNEQLIVEFCSR